MPTYTHWIGGNSFQFRIRGPRRFDPLLQYGVRSPSSKVRVEILQQESRGKYWLFKTFNFLTRLSKNYLKIRIGDVATVTVAFTAPGHLISEAQAVFQASKYSHQPIEAERHPAFAPAHALQLQSKPFQRLARHQCFYLWRALKETPSFLWHRSSRQWRIWQRWHGPASAKVSSHHRNRCSAQDLFSVSSSNGSVDGKQKNDKKIRIRCFFIYPNFVCPLQSK